MTPNVSFAGPTFYCPAPSDVRAVPATNPYPSEPGYNYVGVNEVGVTFQSLRPELGDKAPKIVSFYFASWHNLSNGSANCYYKDKNGRTQAITARNTPQPIVIDGPNWSPENTCYMKNRFDCAFKFKS